MKKNALVVLFGLFLGMSYSPLFAQDVFTDLTDNPCYDIGYNLVLPTLLHATKDNEDSTPALDRTMVNLLIAEQINILSAHGFEQLYSLCCPGQYPPCMPPCPGRLFTLDCEENRYNPTILIAPANIKMAVFQKKGNAENGAALPLPYTRRIILGEVYRFYVLNPQYISGKFILEFTMGRGLTRLIGGKAKYRFEGEFDNDQLKINGEL